MVPTLDLDVNVKVKVNWSMRIGELSKVTGVSSRALRYYEQQGLLRSERRPNGYREYAPESAEVVAFVQDMFHAGLSSDVIRDILPCARDEHPGGDCAALLARVRQVRDELARQERHIAERRRRLDAYLTDGYGTRPVPPPAARAESVR